MKAAYALVTGLALSLCACSLTAQRSADNYTFFEEDSQSLERAKAAWQILGDPNRRDEWPQAIKDYNANIEQIALHLKQLSHSRKLDRKHWSRLPFHIDSSPYAHGPQWRYEAIYGAEDIDSSFRLQEEVTVQGLGIPFAGLAPKTTDIKGAEMLKNNGNVHTLTAILDFDRQVNGKPVLRAVPRLLHEHVAIGKNKVKQPLAANFSMPIALFWQLSDADGTELLGAFRPKKTINNMGLYFSEPFDSRKIPVLFTHGLMSGPSTFANLTNRLLVDPVIREHYQFWFFGYPSGLPWTVSAAQQRQAMEEMVMQYRQNSHRSQEMKSAVMVGHSMGGLITRFNTSTKPWTLMKGVFNLPEASFNKMNLSNWRQSLASLNFDEHALKRLHEHFFFTPPPAVTRIVYMATPHRGSSFAENWIGKLGRQLTSIPAGLLEEVTHIATLSRGMFLLNPGQLKDELTSIRLLSPESTLIKHMSELRSNPKVHVHCIVGDRGKGDAPDSSDGIVPYASSHLDWAASEKIVPSGHSVQDHPEAAVELRRILREHLIKLKGRKYVEAAYQRAATPIWQSYPKPPVILRRP